MFFLNHLRKVRLCLQLFLVKGIHSSNFFKFIHSRCSSSSNQIIWINQISSFPRPVKYQKQKYNIFQTQIYCFHYLFVSLFFWENLRYIYNFWNSKIISKIRFQKDSQYAFSWKMNPIQHEVSLWRNHYMWRHCLLKIEMKWEETNSNVYKILVSLNVSKNSVYLIIFIMPTGNWNFVIFHKVVSSLLEIQVLY